MNSVTNKSRLAERQKTKKTTKLQNKEYELNKNEGIKQNERKEKEKKW